VAHWSSGWLDKGEVQISVVRVQKSSKVRLTIWEEAGDRDSSIGTATSASNLKPKKIRHC
jgi:diaminopimelate epimerase